MDKNSIRRAERLEKFVEKTTVKECVTTKDKYESCVLAHSMGTIFSMCNYELDMYKKCLFDRKK